MNFDHIAKVDRADGSVVLPTNDDAVAKNETTFSDTLRGHFSRRRFSSSEGIGVVCQFDPFVIPGVFIVEEVEIEPVHLP